MLADARNKYKILLCAVSEFQKIEQFSFPSCSICRKVLHICVHFLLQTYLKSQSFLFE